MNGRLVNAELTASASNQFHRKEECLSETTHGQTTDVQGDSPNIDSLAKLCSVGALPIPDDLPEDQQRQLLLAVAARRRKRLIHLFATAIAEDIWRERQAQGKPNVEN